MTMAAGNVARDAGEKEKEKDKAELRSAAQPRAAVPTNAVPTNVEKRRALGRGLESLLPGPRVVATAGPGKAAEAPKSPPPATPARSGAPTPDAAEKQVPYRPEPVRNDNPERAVRNDIVDEARFDGVIRAEVDPEYAVEKEEMRTAHPVAQNATRVGQPAGLSRPPAEQQVPHRPAPVRNDISGESEYGIEIMAMAESRTPPNLVVNLALDQIQKNPYQTRYVDDNDNLEELANSIRANGIIQPITVRPSEEDGKFILILGERRLTASRMAGKTTIPALVKRVSDQTAAEMTIIENLQREDLSALEQAQAFKVLSQEFKMTQQQIGDRVGLSRISVANYMRLLKLPREVMQMLAEKRISFSEARELLVLEDDDKIAEAALYAVKKGLTLEQIERLVLSMNGALPAFPGMPGAPKKSSGARWVDPNVRSAQVDLERLLGVRVRIRDRKGKGRIVIEYSTVDDYERVVEALRGKK